MKKTRVYIDVFYYKTALSGVKTYIEELVYATLNHGSDDIEYIFSHDISKMVNNQLFVNSKYRLIRWLFQIRYLFWKQIFLPIKLILNKADIVICPDYVAPIISSCQKIVVIHDNLFWKYPKNYPSLWRKYFITIINWGLNNNTKIVTTSNYSLKGLSEIFKKNDIFSVYQSSEIFKLKSKTAGHKKYILHIGTFEKRKNLLILIKAFKKLKDEENTKFKLVLAGSTYINGHNETYRKIEKFIHEHNLFSSILIPGYISNNEAKYFFSNAKMYIFPSIDEGFGIPLIEALKLNIPVICSNIPIFKEIEGDSALYFEKNNVDDLYEKMKILIQNQKLLKKLTLKGKEKVKKFNRNNFIKEFEKIYN